MVRLTEEEMKALRPDVPACEQTVFGCDCCSGGCPIVAKAQLKKVVEYLKERASFMEWEGKDSEGIWDIVLDDIAWQALLEEVKK